MADETEQPDPELDADGNPVPAPIVEPPKDDDRVAKLELSFAELNGRYASLQENYNVLLANQAAQHQGRTPAEPELLDVPEEEIQAAVEAGDGRKVAQLMRRQAKIEAERTVRAFKAAEVDPITQAMGVGINALSSHAMAIASTAKDEKDRPRLPFARRFEREIATTLNRLDPQQRTSAEAITSAHDLFVGQNFYTLVEEEIERRARSKVADPGVTPSTRRGATDRVPEPEDIGGGEVMPEIARHGGKDEFARKFGFKDWATYMAETKNYRRSA